MSYLAINSSQDGGTKESSPDHDHIKQYDHVDEDLMADLKRDDDDGYTDSDESDEMHRFKPVLDAIDLEGLPQLAVSVRVGKVHSDTMDASITCKVVTPPITGSYNLLYRLEFSDGVCWMLKVPATGHRARFDELAAQALTSEALTMRLLKRKTTIPVPEVYLFNASLDNEVKCPFIMMECLEGRSLHELWFQPWNSQAAVEQFRERVLQQLAAAIVQLGAFTYDEGGSLLFDKAGNVAGIGPARVVDLGAEYRRLYNHDDEDDDDSPLYYAKGPVKDPKSFLNSALERGPHQQQPSRHNQGMHTLLTIFTEWMSYDYADAGSPFVLAHPDLALQNVLVSDDGSLQGVIDWDGAAAIPRCFGQYPLWLMRDWDPESYNWDFAKSETNDEYGPPEDSPERLKYYRKMYAQFVDQNSLTTEVGCDMGPTQGFPMNSIISKVALDAVNPKSLLFHILAVAVEDPMSMARNMRFIFDGIERLTAADWDIKDTKTDPDASSDQESISDLTLDCLPGSAGTQEQPGQAITTEVKEAREEVDLSKHQIVQGPEVLVAEAGGNGLSHGLKPLCHRVQDGFHYMTKLLHKGKISPDAIAPRAEMVDVCPKGIPDPRTQEKLLCIANKKDLSKDIKPQPAIIRPTDVEACSSGSVKIPRGWLPNSLRAMGFLRKKFSKESSEDRGICSEFNGACPSENVKPRGDRLRSALQHTMAALSKNKVSKSSKDPEPRPVNTEACKIVAIEPLQDRMRSFLHWALPCLQKGQVEKPRERASVSPTPTEDDHVWDQFRIDLEDAGVSAALISEFKTFFIAAVIQAAQHKHAREDIIQPFPKSSQSTDPTEDEGSASVRKITQQKSFNPSTFALYSITHSLADNVLPNEVMKRLEEGFAAIVASAT